MARVLAGRAGVVPAIRHVAADKIAAAAAAALFPLFASVSATVLFFLFTHDRAVRMIC